MNAESAFVVVRDVSLNEAIWLFSFRYWAISFAIPWQLSGKERPTWFNVVAVLLFSVGVISNFIVPVLYSYYAFKLNNALAKGEDAHSQAWQKYS